MPPTHTPAAALKQLPDSIKRNLKLIHVGIRSFDPSLTLTLTAHPHRSPLTFHPGQVGMRSFDANFKPFGFERVKVNPNLLTPTLPLTLHPNPSPTPNP